MQSRRFNICNFQSRILSLNMIQNYWIATHWVNSRTLVSKNMEKLINSVTEEKSIKRKFQKTSALIPTLSSLSPQSSLQTWLTQRTSKFEKWEKSWEIHLDFFNSLSRVPAASERAWKISTVFNCQRIHFRSISDSSTSTSSPVLSIDSLNPPHRHVSLYFPHPSLKMFDFYIQLLVETDPLNQLNEENEEFDISIVSHLSTMSSLVSSAFQYWLMMILSCSRIIFFASHCTRIPFACSDQL